MTNLNKLDVSLTKHGAHKVAEILDQVEPDQVIASVWLKLKDKSFNDIKIDAAQARKTLSSIKGDKLLPLWHEAKKAGRPTINSLVLLGIIFSHHRLISAMSTGIKGFGKGVIQRLDIDGGKGFTNLKDNFYSLGYASAINEKQFKFDITSILLDKLSGRLFVPLIRQKLMAAGWDQSGSVVNECISLGLHRSLGMQAEQFKKWLAGSAENLDELPEIQDADEVVPTLFSFRPGHKPRKVGSVLKKGSGDTQKARLIHNALQNKIYSYLCYTYGRSNIATEIKSGPPNSAIDIVRKNKKDFHFYEIKTSISLRKCLREAIPQLLEYAYWPNTERANQLIIVSTNKPTKDGRKYLEYLRSTFKLPLYHETVDKKTGSLSQRI